MNLFKRSSLAIMVDNKVEAFLFLHFPCLLEDEIAASSVCGNCQGKNRHKTSGNFQAERFVKQLGFKFAMSCETFMEDNE